MPLYVGTRYPLLGSAAGAAAAGAAGPLDGLSGNTGTVSMGRQLLSSYGGAFYTDVSGAVSSLLDQSGNGRNLTQGTAGARPLVATAGALSRACAAFDGVDDILATTATMADFINADAGYIICSAYIDDITTNGATIYQNDALWGDSGDFVGFHLKSVPTGHAYNWDGNADFTSHTDIAVANEIVAEWRHEGGNIMSRINRGTWESATSGNTSTLTGVLQLGIGTATIFTDVNIFELAAFDAVPSEAQRDALAQNFMDWIGAA